MRSRKPVDSHIFAGMETAVEEQATAAAIQTAAELSARMIEDRPSIDAKVGKMERDSPLFYGIIEPTLF